MKKRYIDTFVQLEHTIFNEEIYGQFTNRVTVYPGSVVPVDIYPRPEIGYGTDMRLAYLHDAANAFKSAVSGLHLRACAIDRIGWKSLADRKPWGGHGFELYLQCDENDDPIVVSVCLVTGGCEDVKAWGSGGTAATPNDRVWHIHFEDSIFNAANVFIGTGSKRRSDKLWGAHDIHFVDSDFFGQLQLGYDGANEDLELRNCLIVTGGEQDIPSGCFHLKGGYAEDLNQADPAARPGKPAWKQFTCRDNTLVATNKGGAGCPVFMMYNTPLAVVQSYDMNDNTYFHDYPKPFYVDGLGWMDLATWKLKTGQDSRSKSYPLSELDKIVRTHSAPEYGISLVSVVNPELVTEVDMPASIPPGNRWVRRAWNFSDLLYRDTLPTTGTRAVPSGWTGPIDEPPWPKSQEPFLSAYWIEGVVMDPLTPEDQLVIDEISAELGTAVSDVVARLVIELRTRRLRILELETEAAEVPALLATIADFRTRFETIRGALPTPPVVP